MKKQLAQSEAKFVFIHPPLIFKAISHARSYEYSSQLMSTEKKLNTLRSQQRNASTLLHEELILLETQRTEVEKVRIPWSLFYCVLSLTLKIVAQMAVNQRELEMKENMITQLSEQQTSAYSTIRYDRYMKPRG